MAEQLVELAPGESKVVSFEAVAHKAKTYQVSVNGLTRSFTAAPPPPFIFSNVSVSSKVCPTATAYWVHVFDCRISNPTDKAITHTITHWMQEYSHTYGVWRGPRAIEAFEVSLAPGASQNYHYDGYGPHCDGNWCCTPPLMMHYTYYFWLEDELGNQSEKVSIYRP
ncbi:hypothetical protein ES703_81245 [subsurface metagenome]